MKIGTNKLRMSNGDVRTFASQQKRDNFERVARAVKHGWTPNGPMPGHVHPTHPGTMVMGKPGRGR